MQKGFNSDISVRGQSVHVQTEDWGLANPFLVSRIFKSGAVLRTIKVSYDEALRGGPVNQDEAIRQALKRQHHRVLDELLGGQIPL